MGTIHTHFVQLPPRRGRLAFTLIELLVVIAITAILLGLILAGVQKVRAAAVRAQCGNHLKQLGLALHMYHDSYNVLPPGCSNVGSREPTPFMSWMTRLLPYVEQDALWKEALSAYQQDKWFESVPHRPVLGLPMQVFTCPADGRTLQPVQAGGFTAALTSYQGVEGINLLARDGVLYFNSRVHFSDVVDGLSNTLMVGERPPSANGLLGWWYAGWGQAKDGSAEFVLGVRELNVYPSWEPSLHECAAGPYEYGPGSIDNQCDAFHFWSMHGGGANFLLCDGSVRFLSYSVAPLMPALATRNGGEAAQLPD